MAKKDAMPSATTENEFAGYGGSYLVDPETGKCTLVERTQPADLINDANSEVNDVSSDT